MNRLPPIARGTVIFSGALLLATLVTCQPGCTQRRPSTAVALVPQAAPASLEISVQSESVVASSGSLEKLTVPENTEVPTQIIVMPDPTPVPPRVARTPGHVVEHDNIGFGDVQVFVNRPGVEVPNDNIYNLPTDAGN